MFTAKFYIDTKRNNALMLRITNNRKKAELSLGFHMTEETLADVLSLKPRTENLRYRSLIMHWQLTIDNMRVQFARDYRANEDVKVIKSLLSEAFWGTENESEEQRKSESPIGNFVPFFKGHADAYMKRSTRESNEYTLSCMRKFRPDSLDAMNFEDVNYAWLSDFDKFMEKAGLSQNTRRIHFANIRAAINEAYRRELTDADPFRRFKLKKEKTAKRSLSVEDLRKLFAYKVEPHAVYYRDMFKLMFMFIGINTVDLYGLKGITEDGRIEYRRAKTGRLYSIKTEPEALEIVRRYKGTETLLNIADKYKDHRYFRRDTNDALRLIGEVRRTGRGGKKTYEPLWPELTTYWARHTWATIAASLDIPKDTIAAALGHGGNTVTDIYIDFDQCKVDEANRRVLDWVLYGKR